MCRCNLSGSSAPVSLTQAVINRINAIPTGETSRGVDPKGNVIEYPDSKSTAFRSGRRCLQTLSASSTCTTRRTKRLRSASRASRNSPAEDLQGRARLPAAENDPDTAWYREGPIGWLHGICGGIFAAVARRARYRGGHRPGAIGGVVGYRKSDVDIEQEIRLQAIPAPLEDALLSKRLVFGGTDFGPLQLEVADLALPPGFDGFIGYNFFAKHVVCLDFPGNRLLIRR